MTTDTKTKCPCGREAATPTEHAKAAAAGKCAFCYDFALWVASCIKRPEDCERAVKS